MITNYGFYNAFLKQNSCFPNSNVIIIKEALLLTGSHGLGLGYIK